MNTFLFIVFGFLSLLNPFLKLKNNSHKLQSSPIIAMVDNKNNNYQEVGNMTSKVINSAASPTEGCRTRSEIIDHNNETTTEVVTMTCSKKIKRDKNDNIKTQSDTSKPKYKKSINRFTNSS